MKVFIIAALTADGFVARHADDFSMDWTSPEDVKLFVRLTKEAGVAVMGSRTFSTLITAGRKLPGRKLVVYTTRPQDFTYERNDPTEYTTEAPATLVARLQKEGYPAVAICGGAHIYGQFMQAGVVDELYLHVHPIVMGQGVGLFGHALDHKLALLDHHVYDDGSVLLHYAVTSASAAGESAGSSAPSTSVT